MGLVRVLRINKSLNAFGSYVLYLELRTAGAKVMAMVLGGKHRWNEMLFHDAAWFSLRLLSPSLLNLDYPV